METGDKYECLLCGNVVEIIEIGGGELYCCGQRMEKTVVAV